MNDDTIFDTERVESGSNATLPKEIPTKRHASPEKYIYEFCGWDGNYFNVTENRTLKAVFQERLRKFTVTFLSGETVFDTQEAEYGQKAWIPSAVPTSGELDFVGWYQDPQGKAEVNFEKDRITSDVMFYAVFQKQVFNFTILKNYQSGRSYYLVEGLADPTAREIEIPPTYRNLPVTKIGFDAFRNCGALTNITIPESVWSIGSRAFQNCGALTKIAIPESITVIGFCAFSGCDSLTRVEIGDLGAWLGIEFEKDFDGNYDSNPLAFARRLYLNGAEVTDLSIPGNTTYVGGGAFFGCESIKSVVIHAGVTGIGEGAFSGCDGIETLVVASGNTKYHSADNCIIETKSKTLVAGCKNSVIPGDGSVARIGSGAFRNCGALTSVEIPASVVNIESFAFYGCDSLAEIALPFIGKSADASGYEAVFGYIFGFDTSRLRGEATTYQFGDGSTDYYYFIPSSIRTITIVGATTIGFHAFYNCVFLTNIFIPESVTSIGEWAFNGCFGTTIYAEAGAKPGSWGEDWNKGGLRVVWDCKNNDVASDGAIYTIRDGIRYAIKDGAATVAVQSCGIRTAAIPRNIVYNDIRYPVTKIGDWAFGACEFLMNIEIPNTVVSIGESAFHGCVRLETFTVEIGNPKYHSVRNCIIETASKTLLAGCKNSVIPGDESVTIIGYGAFYNCSTLTGIVIPDHITHIGYGAFYNCNSLADVVVGIGVTGIDSDAFGLCSKLKVIEYRGTKSDWMGIRKGFHWDYSTGYESYTVRCGDGTLDKNGNEIL